MTGALAVERARVLVDACAAEFGWSPVDANQLTALIALQPKWEPAEWVAANKSRLRLIIAETNRYALSSAVVVAVVALLEHDRYALRDYWLDHESWDNLELIRSVAGQRLPEP